MNLSGSGQIRIWLMFIYILMENPSKFGWAESGWFPFWFCPKINGTWSGAPQSRMWSVFIWILLENLRNLVWDIPDQNVNDCHLILGGKSKEISSGQPKAESVWFSNKFQYKINGHWSGTPQSKIRWIFILNFKRKINGNWFEPAQKAESGRLSSKFE